MVVGGEKNHQLINWVISDVLSSRDTPRFWEVLPVEFDLRRPSDRYAVGHALIRLGDSTQIYPERITANSPG